VVEAKAPASIFDVEGVGKEKLAPPSSVRTRTAPESVVATHSCAVAQRMAVRLTGLAPPMSFGVQVCPPSVVTRNSEAAPTA
jgi:hypothetical protein